MEEHDIVVTVYASCKGDTRPLKQRIQQQLELLVNPDREDVGLTLVGNVTIRVER